MRISDWSSDVCSSDLRQGIAPDVLGVVLHPAGLREVLRQLLLRLAEAAAIAGEKNGAAAGGSLVDGENAAFGTHAGSPGLELQLFLFVAVPAAGRGCRGSAKIGRAHVGTPVTNAHLVCRLLLDKKK